MHEVTHSVPAHIPPERVLEFDIYNDPRLAPDVHQGYLKIFAEAPAIFWTPLNGGHWVAMGHDALSEILTTPTLFSSRQLHIPADEHAPAFIPASLDPPEHAIYRRVIASHLMPNSLAKSQDHIRGLAASLIDAVRMRGECEFIKDIAERLPISVFMGLMGLPLERFEEFRAMAVGILATNDTTVRVALFHKVVAELDALVAARRRQPEDDLISKILEARIDGAALEEHRVRSLCLNLFLGGLDTVTNAMGFLARHLAGDSALQQQLASNPAKIPDAVAECLRRYGFVNAVRQVTQNLTYRGVHMSANDMLFCALPTVGFDEQVNPDPLKFNLSRSNRIHFAFSHGAHTCAGLHLARLELRILFEEWLKRISNFRIPSDAKLHAHAGVVMGLDALPLVWDSSATIAA